MNETIDRFQKNALEEIRASLTEFNNHKLVDLRIWTENKSGEFVPTRKGVSPRVRVTPFRPFLGPWSASERLWWSGDIEQDADLVTFIHREDLYSDGGAGEPVVDAELIVKKNRHGPTGTALVKFVKRTTHFVQEYSYGDYEAGTA